MARGIQLSRTTNFSSLNNATLVGVSFDVATPIGDGVVSDFFDPVVDDTGITLSASGGTRFMAAVTGYTLSTTGGDNRFGLQLVGGAFGGPIPRINSRPSRSVRTPLYPWVDNLFIGFYHRPYFNGTSISWDGGLTKVSVLVDPVPIAIATIASGAQDVVAEPSSDTVFEPSALNLVDPQSTYDAVTKSFIAPAGVAAVDVTMNCFGDPTDTADYVSRVKINGVTVSEFSHPNSLRSPAFSYGGLHIVRAGDEVSITHNGAASRTDYITYGVTFY